MATTDLRRSLTELTGPLLVGLFLAVLSVVLAVDLVRQVAVGTLAVSQLLSLVWSGIVDSLYIGLAAIGLSMTYSILQFANFAHGDLITTGAFTGWTVAYVIGGVGAADLGSRLLIDADGGAQASELGIDIVASPVAIVLGLVAAAALTIAVALFVDRVVFKRLRDADGITVLIASVGVALAVRYLIALVYTQDSRVIVASAPTAFGVNLHEATLVVIAVVLIVGVHLLLQYTKLGKSMRAMADNKSLALVTGIPTERVVAATWVIGAGLAGVAGYLIVLDRGQIGINLGWFLLLLIFAGTILGGIGSIYGAIAGSLVIGLTLNVSLVWIPADLTYIAAFSLMILVLLFRPDGLFGGVETT